MLIAGAILALLGLLIVLGGRIPFLGRLPGDIVIERENFTLYFPLTTSLLISVVITLLFLLFRK